MHLMNMIVKLLSTAKRLSAFFACVRRLYGVLSVYRIDNDKCTNDIEKHTVTMLTQHYRNA